MKMRYLLIVLIILNISLGYNLIKKSEREVVDLSEFSDYYTTLEADNGGYVLLSSNFTVYEKEYKILSEKQTEIKKEKEEKAKEKGEKRTKTITYVVKSGDTLGGIANKFGQSITVLKHNNPKVGKYLKIGEKIKITPGNSVSYKVTKGDTLGGIANKYGITISKLKEANNLTSNTLRIGKELWINDPKVNLSTMAKSGVAFDVYWPVAWKGVTSPYGRRFHPVLKRWIGHMGVDLRAHYVPVKAAESGTVTYAGWMSGYGNIVIIRHAKGYETRYGHLKTIKVKKGQKVSRGHLIAISGMTGRVTGPHLHFEIRKNGTPVDPMKYFK